MNQLINQIIYGVYFDIDSKKKRIKELEDLMTDDGFWNDVENSNLVISELNSLKNIIKELMILMIYLMTLLIMIQKS